LRISKSKRHARENDLIAWNRKFVMHAPQVIRVKLVSLAKAPPAINNVALPAMGGAVRYMLSALA